MYRIVDIHVYLKLPGSDFNSRLNPAQSNKQNHSKVNMRRLTFIIANKHTILFALHLHD